MSDKRHLEAVLKKGTEKANIIAEENLKKDSYYCWFSII